MDERLAGRIEPGRSDSALTKSAPSSKIKWWSGTYALLATGTVAPGAGRPMLNAVAVDATKTGSAR